MGVLVRAIRRRTALAVTAFVVLVVSSGLSATAQKQPFPRAVLEKALLSRLAQPSRAAELVIVSAWTRPALRALDRMHLRYTHLKALPMAFVRLTPGQIARLARTDGIRSVWSVHKERLLLNESAKLIGARYAADRLKVTGAGSTVAVIDTGIDTTHPDFAGAVLHSYEVVVPERSDPVPVAPLFVENPMSDDNEHGTHVSGTIAGRGILAKTDPDYAGRDLRGVAPGAKLIVYSVNAGELVLTTHTLSAFDDIIANVRQTHIRAISNSWGGGDGADFDPNDPVSISIEHAWRAGIVPVFAAGNSGSPGDVTGDGVDTLSSECISPFAVCVAAETKHRQVVTFSSRGRPSGNWDRALAQKFNVGLYRPTISAPGVDITAPAALAAARDSDKPQGYLTISGTSMATPHITGVVALMTAANPKLTPAQITTILEQTADQMPGWNAYEAGAGSVNARAAVEAALAMKHGKRASLHLPQFRSASPASAERVLGTFEGTALPASFLHGLGVETKDISVPAGTQRLRVLVNWTSRAENLYGFLWAPGDTPNDSDPQAAPFPTQESWGLLCTGPCTLAQRELVVSYPRQGTWKLRVYGRTLATDYYGSATALVYGAPTVTTVLGEDRLTGTAVFPAMDPVLPRFEPVPGTAITDRAPTTAAYFHGTAPDGKLDDPAPSWNATKPTGQAPKTWTGAAGDVSAAVFEGRLANAVQGDVVVNFWASATLTIADLVGKWEVKISRADTGKLLGAGSTEAYGLSEVPSQITVVVKGISIPAKTPVSIQIDPYYTDGGAHFAVYYDAADMPSGLLIPLAAAAVDVPEMFALDPRTGTSIRLAWPSVRGARGYHVYAGDSPSALRATGITARPGTVSSTTDSVEGFANFANPTAGDLGVVGVTETEFVATCDAEGPPQSPDDLFSQGLDGYLVAVPRASASGKQTITIRGEPGFPYDFDVSFYDATCEFISTLTSGAANETGRIPKGTAWAVVNLTFGIGANFTAVMTHPPATVPAMTATVGGLKENRAAYFRVSALDKAGREGGRSAIVSAAPASLRRFVEISVEGASWKSVPVRMTSATSGVFSVPLSTLGISSDTPSSLRVRARAGDAVGPIATTRVAGKRLSRTLPSTGLAGANLGAALLAAAACLAAFIRRRRPA
jgi:serine protease AprX